MHTPLIEPPPCVGALVTCNIQRLFRRARHGSAIRWCPQAMIVVPRKDTGSWY